MITPPVPRRSMKHSPEEAEFVRKFATDKWFIVIVTILLHIEIECATFS